MRDTALGSSRVDQDDPLQASIRYKTEQIRRAAIVAAVEQFSASKPPQSDLPPQ